MPRAFCDGRRQAKNAARRKLSRTFFAAASLQNRDAGESSRARKAEGVSECSLGVTHDLRQW